MLSNKMLVGITQRIDKVMDRAELRDALDHRVVQWLVKAGFLPVPVPNALQDAYELRMPTLDSWLQSVRPYRCRHWHRYVPGSALWHSLKNYPRSSMTMMWVYWLNCQ